jgi:photosystem I P700 chlorophyll a apoprotein A1
LVLAILTSCKSFLDFVSIQGEISMAISSTDRPTKNVQVFVEKDAVETSFTKWAQPGHFSRTLAKGPKTTTWIWNLHADAHDFDGQTSAIEEVSRKIFSAHFGQLAVFLVD